VRLAGVMAVRLQASWAFFSAGGESVDHAGVDFASGTRMPFDRGCGGVVDQARAFSATVAHLPRRGPRRGVLRA
jgi:hypothetical protein